jgi:hypothetical protein
MFKSKDSVFIFVVLSLTSFFIDQMTSDCKTPSTITFINTFIHHFLSTYMWFGSLIFGYYDIHVIIVSLTVLGWQIWGACPVTWLYNMSCSIPEETSHKDLMYRITRLPIFNYYPMISLIVAYDLFKGGRLSLK